MAPGLEASPLWLAEAEGELRNTVEARVCEPLGAGVKAMVESPVEIDDMFTPVELDDVSEPATLDDEGLAEKKDAVVSRADDIAKLVVSAAGRLLLTPDEELPRFEDALVDMNGTVEEAITALVTRHEQAEEIRKAFPWH
jgi:hypothetical protein